MIKLVILDMAGTTIEDRGLARCFSDALECAGIRATQDDILARMGRSKIEVFEELARRMEPDHLRARKMSVCAYAKFRQTIERDYAPNVRPIAGSAEALSALKRSGLRTAINSGFPRGIVLAIVQRLGWRADLDAI